MYTLGRESNAWTIRFSSGYIFVGDPSFDPNAFIVFGLSVIGNTSFSIEIEFSIYLVNRSGRAKVRTERRKGEINLFYLRKNWKKFRGKDRKKERGNTILSFALKSVYFYDTFYTFCSQNCNNKGAVVIISQDFPVYFLGILNCPRR